MNLVLSVIIMALASYLPRVIPLVFCRKPITSVFFKSLLFYMPYAVLACLTFPSIFYSTNSIITASVGTGIALVMSYFKVNLAIVAVVCVAVVFGLGFVI